MNQEIPSERNGLMFLCQRVLTEDPDLQKMLSSISSSRFCNYPNIGKEHYVSFVYGDYDVVPMTAVVEGQTIKLKGGKNGEVDGYIWRAYAPVAWNDMLDGEVTIKINAPNEPYVAFDYAVLDIKPITTPEPDTEFSFDNGVVVAYEEGNVCIDWLYDGGAYKGEMGIFILTGMEKLTSGSKEFNAEAVRRVLSNSQEGYLVISDPNEAECFSGQLSGESADWNSGKYNGIKCFDMRPCAWFATVLVPNSTFKELAKDPGTTGSSKRPLYSLVASNPAYGMYLGQVADINGLGNAFVYEDICASNSDKDYNDLIFQITGATTADIQTLDSLVWKKTRAARSGWTYWRTKSELGKQIIAHLESLHNVNSETEKLTVTLNGSGDINITDSQGGVIGKEGGYIAGALFGKDENGNQVRFSDKIRIRRL